MLPYTGESSVSALKEYSQEKNLNSFSSFRDPSGYIFRKEGIIYRCIKSVYKDNYDALMSSGLYYALVEKGYIIPHIEVDKDKFLELDAYKIIEPIEVLFISYPYEWSFSQLKDAAILTLNIMKTALQYNMVLKDASAYNIQFLSGKPIMIDTLSFEKYVKGDLWIAYSQFFRHFVAPLVLMAHNDVRLNQLLKVYIDGIPLDLVSAILPLSAKFNWFIASNILWQAKRNNKKNIRSVKYNLPKSILEKYVNSLISNISNIKLKHRNSFWTDYYQETDSYTSRALLNKRKVVSSFINRIHPKIIWDIGANTGEFSLLASDSKVVVSFDTDAMSVERNYLTNKGSNILPLIIDLTNPSPSIGWNNEERMSLCERGPADLIMALAIMHHLAISNNVPFSLLAKYMHDNCKSLIIEYVPKDDSKVKEMLVSRKDIFDEYSEFNFENEFMKYFLITDKKKIEDSKRILYLMERK